MLSSETQYAKDQDEPMGKRLLGPVSALGLFTLLLFLIPAPMRVSALGTAGHPATVLSIAAFLWWCWYHLARRRRLSLVGQPVRKAILVYLLVSLVVYAQAMSVPIPGDEISPADSALLRLLGGTGLMLVACDGLRRFADLWTVCRRLAEAAGFVSLLAIVQFVTGRIWVDAVQIPGLTSARGELSLAARGALNRPSGTATTAIELAMVLAVTLPLIITVARNSSRHRAFYWAMALFTSLAIVLTLSRTGIVCTIVALACLLPAWPRNTRFAAAGLAVVLFAGTYVAVPGIAATYRGLFGQADGDPSVQSRTDAYGIVFAFVENRPWFGRGSGTFLPKYWILDNLYLGQLIETGVVGVGALLLLIAVAAWGARRASKTASQPEERELNRSIMAGIVACAVGFAFFDGFPFPESAGTFFLLIGLAAAGHRLSGNSRRRVPKVPGDRGVER